MNQKRRTPKTKKDNTTDTMLGGTNPFNAQPPICAPLGTRFITPQIITPTVTPTGGMIDFTKRTEKISVFNFNYENPRIEFDCDIMLVELIKLLNILNFNTEYCCSGHMEDAFLSFYIRFDSIGDDVLNYFITLVKSVQGLYLEKEIEFIPENTGSGCHYVQLTDPIDDDIDAAIKLVFKGKTIDDFDDLYKHGLINKYYTIRHKIKKEFEAGSFDAREYVERNRDSNYGRVKSSIETFTNKLYIYLSCRLNHPEQFEKTKREFS